MNDIRMGGLLDTERVGRLTCRELVDGGRGCGRSSSCRCLSLGPGMELPNARAGNNQLCQPDTRCPTRRCVPRASVCPPDFWRLPTPRHRRLSPRSQVQGFALRFHLALIATRSRNPESRALRIGISWTRPGPWPGSESLARRLSFRAFLTSPTAYVLVVRHVSITSTHVGTCLSVYVSLLNSRSN